MKGQNLKFRNYKFHLESRIEHHSLMGAGGHGRGKGGGRGRNWWDTGTPPRIMNP